MICVVYDMRSLWIVLIPVVILILVVFVAAPIAGGQTVLQKKDTERTLFDFEDSSQSNLWVAVNDNVMGGISKGSALMTEDCCLSFSGSISLENNGGFASIRTLPTDFELAEYKGIRIKVKGDGRTYQFRLRAGKAFDGIAFKQEFDTVPDDWLEIELPFESFLPSYRGRILGDVKPIDPADIRQIGFLIADKIEGPFSLAIERIVAYK
jgi:monofunctional biosynthetic peptidoglycan transglycosylase